MLKNWELYFLYEKRKQKDVTRRAPSSFENLTDSVKKFIQLKPSLLIYPGSMKAWESRRHWHQMMHFILDLWKIVLKVQRQRSEGFLYSRPTILLKWKKTEIRKATLSFWGNEDHKDRLTAASEYHSGSNNTYYWWQFN